MARLIAADVHGEGEDGASEGAWGRVQTSLLHSGWGWGAVIDGYRADHVMRISLGETGNCQHVTMRPRASHGPVHGRRSGIFGCRMDAGLL
jgi:hypothetical protein